MSDRIAYMKAYHKKWYAEVMKKRRAEWFAENGPCVDCGSWENLELDHVDPETKVHHAIWSWSQSRRASELEKCKPRCRTCHKKKSVRENRERGIYGRNKKKIVKGKTWCRGCQKNLPLTAFNKDKHAANGCYARCKKCRRKLPSRASTKSPSSSNV